MAFDWMRRALAGLASGVVLLALGACGSGTIESQFVPTRLIVFGDAMADVGQAGRKYTVNSATAFSWPSIVAADYGLTLTPSTSGGLGYATGNARIVNKPDAAGNSVTPTVKEQIDAFLVSHTLTSTDLVTLQAGYSDIIVEMAKVTAGTQSGNDLLNNVAQAARDLAAQIKRLEAAGGSHIAVLGVYNLGRSPWAIAIGQQTLLTQASSKFNETLLIALVDEGRNVLYVDSALQFETLILAPTGYGLTNVTVPVCTSVDTGPGIGIGANQINSALCTETTVLPGVVYNTYMFADRIYTTPTAQRLLGDYTYSRVHSRW